LRTIWKKIFDAGQYPKNINIALLLLRAAAGIFMLTHGMGKIAKLFSDAPVQFADPIGIGPAASLALTVFAEVVCSFLLFFGAATRPAAAILFINMFIAGLVVHGGDPFNKMELALLYGVVHAALAIAGAGKYSVDNFLYRGFNKNA
jgi:putative oxidoreductase